ncbi:recombinase family protein [Chelatococcus reniformis]|uniref:Recombinase n=1 Tax=Chelatococcus reniformis TaxID=1494448 RepID=A0A916UX09_9HYPH|nr:recombinase family protein [Chelatococcus reniformis]GGC91362.1 recombinase [Chelatococcus reniformis]
MRSAIYTRYSTDLQNEKSIEDQVALCRAYAAREGLSVAAVYEDRARSGGSILGRDGLMQLMERARAGDFDVVIVEALDRMSRDMEDLAGIHKRLTFMGVEIRAVHEGAVNTVLVGLRGLVGQLYREDGALKVRRGMSGVVRDGRHAGGRAYGYRADPRSKGELVVDEAEAAVVLRIFTEYAAGATPRDIAHGLNRARILPPRGRSWNASTINGNTQRGNGILRNRLYVGEIVWNKVRMVKDPDTGRRVSRPNPESAWQTAKADDLAIVPLDLFAAAQERKAINAPVKAEHQRRPRHMLSGLLRCGCCGAGMSTNGKDKSGRIRIRCSAAAENGTCPDPKTFYLIAVENAVLEGLRAELSHPKVLAEYVREFHAEMRRLHAKAGAQRSRIERRLSEIDRDQNANTDHLLKQVPGSAPAARIAARMDELQTEENRLRIELGAAPELPPLIALHPTALVQYERQLERLQEAVTAGIAAGDGEAAAALRDLVERVTVHRNPDIAGGVKIEIKGRLNALLGEAACPNRVRGVWGAVVAEEGLEPPTRGL